MRLLISSVAWGSPHVTDGHGVCASYGPTDAWGSDQSFPDGAAHILQRCRIIDIRSEIVTMDYQKLESENAAINRDEIAAGVACGRG